MTDSPQTTAIFFPPRLLSLDLSAGDHNEVLDDAVERYIADSLVLPDEEGVKEAMKIIEFAKGFPKVTDPQWKP